MLERNGGDKTDVKERSRSKSTAPVKENGGTALSKEKLPSVERFCSD